MISFWPKLDYMIHPDEFDAFQFNITAAEELCMITSLVCVLAWLI